VIQLGAFHLGIHLVQLQTVKEVIQLGAFHLGIHLVQLQTAKKVIQLGLKSLSSGNTPGLAENS
jgi:hypothetical protein